MKKILGILFYAIAVLLILSILGRLGEFIGDFINLFRIFSSKLDGFERGQILGSVFVWVAIFAVIYYLFKYGTKFIKTKK